MPPPAPASVLSRQTALFADLDRVLDDPLPDVSDQLRDPARDVLREWVTGPLLTLGRQMVQPPPPDDPTRERWSRMATLLLHHAWSASVAERELSTIDTEGCGTESWPESVRSAQQRHTCAVAEMEGELLSLRESSEIDRERLKAAIREVADSLLPRTHQELYDWVMERQPPVAEPARGQPAAPRKGKNAEAKMLKKLSDDPSSFGWSAEEWGQFLGERVDGQRVQDLEESGDRGACDREGASD